jgi:predicted transcriptional regulator
VLDDDKKLDLDSLDQLLEDAELMQGLSDPSRPAPQAAAMSERASAAPPVTDQPKVTSAPEPAPTLAPKMDEPKPRAATERPTKSAQDKKKATDSKQDAWTEQEMDGIKKLVIIFGSTILVLSLAAVGIAVGGLFKASKTDPEVITALEETKIGVEETYKIAENNNREIKELAQRMTEIITQLSDTEAVMNDIKAINEEQLQAASAPAVSMSAKKAALAAANASAGESTTADTTPAKPAPMPAPTQMMTASGNDPQVMGLSADMKDIKRRLASTQKALDNLQKQSTGLQQQSQQLVEMVKSVETEVKSRKSVKTTTTNTTSVPAKTSKVAEESIKTPYRDEQTYRYAPPKPVDDAAARMRWQQQMDKTDSFP